MAAVLVTAGPAWATPRVALPDVQAEGLGLVAGSRLGDGLAEAFVSQGCAIPMREAAFAAGKGRELVRCGGQPACVAGIGRSLGAEQVVQGAARADGNGVVLELSYVPVSARAAPQRRSFRAADVASLAAALRADSKLCEPFAAAPAEPPKPAVAALPDLDLELDLEPAAPKPTPAPASAAFDDLPLPELDIVPATPLPAPALVVAPKPAAPPTAPVAVVTPPPVPPAAVAPPAEPGVLPQSSVARGLLYGSGAVAGLAALAGAGAGFATLQSVNARAAAVDAPTWRAAQASAESRAFGANVLFVIAGAAAATAAGSWLAGDALFSPASQVTSP